MANSKLSLKERYGKEIKEMKADGTVNIVAEQHLGEEFVGLLDQREEVQGLLAELEDEKDRLSALITDKLIRHGYMGCAGDTRKAYILTQNRTSINKTKLVEKGVSPTLIDACTDHSEVYSFRVDKVKPSGC